MRAGSVFFPVREETPAGGRAGSGAQGQAGCGGRQDVGGAGRVGAVHCSRELADPEKDNPRGGSSEELGEKRVLGGQPAPRPARPRLVHMGCSRAARGAVPSGP